jgi:multicomponent Na+:H+ antiporter subunit E
MESDHPGSTKPGGFLSLWLLLTIVWFAANSSLAVGSILTGALLSAVLSWVFVRHFPAWADIRLSPSRLVHFIRYTGVFAIEMVRANLNMLRYVYAPRRSDASRLPIPSR